MSKNDLLKSFKQNEEKQQNQNPETSRDNPDKSLDNSDKSKENTETSDKHFTYTSKIEENQEKGRNMENAVTLVTQSLGNKDLLTENEGRDTSRDKGVTSVTVYDNIIQNRVTSVTSVTSEKMSVTSELIDGKVEERDKRDNENRFGHPFLRDSVNFDISIQFPNLVTKITMFFEIQSKRDYCLAHLYIFYIKKEWASYKDLSDKTKIKIEEIRKYIQRMNDDDLILKIKENNFNYLKLTEKGIQYVESKWEEYQKKQEQNNKSLPEKSHIDNIYTNLEFFFDQKEYYPFLLEASRKNTYLLLNYNHLIEYNLDIAEYLLEEPDGFFELCKNITKNIAERTIIDNPKSIPIHIYNIPESKQVQIGSIRSKHVNQFISVMGDLKQKSKSQPEVVRTYVECTGCGRGYTVPGDKNIPQECRECGWKSFRILDEVRRDMQKLVVEERLDSYEEERNPRSVNCVLYDENASYDSDKKTVVGQKIVVNGILRLLQTEKKKAQKRLYDYLLEVNHFEMAEETFSELKITPDDLLLIQKMSKDERLIENICESVFGDIHQRNEIKKALLLQQFVPPVENTKRGIKKRPYSHILLIGDAGQGKSLFIKGLKKIAPKWRMAAGGGTTGVGLIGAVIKNEFLGMWMLEAGAFPSSNKGILFIDEFDKINPEDRQLLHQGMEEGEVNITKANIQALLPCASSVLACANPKYGRFDQYSSVLRQIDMPSTLLSRFDLIFVLKDKPEVEKDMAVAEKILGIETDEKRTIYSFNIIKKYIAYSRQNFNPKITEDQKKFIQKKYTELRRMGYDEQSNTVSFTTRQLQGIVRLIRSSAMCSLRNEVISQDINIAFDLIMHSLKQVATNKEGNIDVTMIDMSGLETTERVQINQFEQLILNCERNKEILDSDLINEAKNKGISEEVLVVQLEKMLHEGKLARFKGNPIIYKRCF